MLPTTSCRSKHVSVVHHVGIAFVVAVGAFALTALTALTAPTALASGPSSAVSKSVFVPDSTTKLPVPTKLTPKLRSGTLRLGYFPNVTHAPAIAGVEGGYFSRALGPDVKLKTFTFNAGPAAIEALNSGAIDAAYVGPNPAINAFIQSKGKALRIVAGSTSGGAFLVVKSSIGSANELKGKKIASPQLGGTQDVALRYWLKINGLKTTLEGGGDVSIIPQANAQTLESFRSGAIDGAWVPEPWASRLILEANARVLVDERDLWPDGRFTTTVLVVNTKFLKDRPDLIQGLLEGQVAAIDFLNADQNRGSGLVNAGIEKLTGRKLADRVIKTSLAHLVFTNDPALASMKTAADHAVTVGLLKKVDLQGIEDLKVLNNVLVAAGKKQVSA